jgi:uncharacterized membrane protein
MTRAELKQQAKDTLRGRWGTAIGMILVYELLIGAIGMIANFIPFIGSVALLVVSVPLSFGFIGQLLKFSRKEQVGVLDYFTIGFNNFGKSWSIVGYTLLKLVGYIIAYVVCTFAMVGLIVASISAESVVMLAIGMIIIGILFFVIYVLLLMKSYLYVLTEYIGNDNPGMSAKEVVEKSGELMRGHRWELFVLELSFIGWAILAMLTCGIGLLWLEPYMQVTTIKFYESLANGNSSNDNVEVITEQ